MQQIILKGHKYWFPYLILSDVEKQSVKTSAGTKTYKQVIKHVYDSGHQLASHTYSHLELGGQSASKIKSEMTKMEAIFRSIIGKNPIMMRPPAGKTVIIDLEYFTDH